MRRGPAATILVNRGFWARNGRETIAGGHRENEGTQLSGRICLFPKFCNSGTPATPELLILMRYWWMVALVTLISARAETTFQSGPQRVSLLEVYTSEGCSSCPPAESWLGEFKNQARLWKEIVPVAFHVDYWDGLGWKDRFAREEYTSRQRAYSDSLGNFFGLHSRVCFRWSRVERMVQRQPFAGVGRSTSGKVGGYDQKSNGYDHLLREFRRAGTRSASGADGNGREFGCACR